MSVLKPISTLFGIESDRLLDDCAYPSARCHHVLRCRRHCVGFTVGSRPRVRRCSSFQFCSCPLSRSARVSIMELFCDSFQRSWQRPENWRPNIDVEALGASDSMLTSEVINRTPNTAYCNKHLNGKPSRCHHCSICQRCVLKMDHYCVWIVNCVGARNYKFFLLFLIYTFLETILDSLSLFPHFIKFFGEATSHSSSAASLAITFIAFILNVAFALSLLCFVVMHTSLLLSNTTTIEVYAKKKATVWKYDLGKKKNIEQVFGTKKLLWFIPLVSEQDLENIPALKGLDFPIRSDAES